MTDRQTALQALNDAFEIFTDDTRSKEIRVNAISCHAHTMRGLINAALAAPDADIMQPIFNGIDERILQHASKHQIVEKTSFGAPDAVSEASEDDTSALYEGDPDAAPDAADDELKRVTQALEQCLSFLIKHNMTNSDDEGVLKLVPPALTVPDAVDVPTELEYAMVDRLIDMHLVEDEPDIYHLDRGNIQYFVNKVWQVASKGLLRTADDGWQSIETAPKDGTAVLLWGGDWIWEAYWSVGRWWSPYEGDEKPICWRPSFPEPSKAEVKK